MQIYINTQFLSYVLVIIKEHGRLAFVEDIFIQYEVKVRLYYSEIAICNVQTAIPEWVFGFPMLPPAKQVAGR